MMSNIKSFYELEIKDINNKPISMEELIGKANEYIKNGYGVYIGSDSQNIGKSTKYATVIAYRFGSRGVHYILSKKQEVLIEDMWTRLWQEAEMSIDVAEWLTHQVSVRV